ncbi:MAG: hypothetical protein FWD25_12740, partial [Clostridia bacterium]|nr:hypothetical protein [Clostridia bacterium]
MQNTQMEFPPSDFLRCIALSNASLIKIGGTPDCSVYLKMEQASGGSVVLRKSGEDWQLVPSPGTSAVTKNIKEVAESTTLLPMDFFSFADTWFYLRGNHLFCDSTLPVEIKGLPEMIIHRQTSALDYPTFMRSM